MGKPKKRLNNKQVGTCRFCGKTGMEWGHHPSGRRLFMNGELHSCAEFIEYKRLEDEKMTGSQIAALYKGRKWGTAQQKRLPGTLAAPRAATLRQGANYPVAGAVCSTNGEPFFGERNELTSQKLSLEHSIKMVQYNLDYALRKNLSSAMTLVVRLRKLKNKLAKINLELENG